MDTVLLSAMEHAFVQGDNTGMTATDTQKNTVYYVAKKCLTYERHSPEDFAVALARHFVTEYPLVSRAEVTVKLMPWRRYVLARGPEVGTLQSSLDLPGCLFGLPRLSNNA